MSTRTQVVFRTFAFVFGDMLSKSVAFLLLPVLTRVLSPAQYGISALFLSTLLIVANVVSLSVHGSVAAQYYRLDALGRKQSIAAAYGVQAKLFLVSSVVGVVFVVLFCTGPRAISSYEFVIFVVCNAFMQGGVQIALTLQRLRDDWKRNIILQSTIVAGTVIGTLLPCLLVKDDWHVRAWGVSAANVLAICMAWRFFSDIFSLPPSQETAAFQGQHARFGLGLIPHTTSYWLKSSADRYMIVIMLGATAAGFYSAAFQLAAVIGVATMSLHQAMQPLIFREFAKVEKGDFSAMRNVWKYLAIFLGIVAGGLGVWMVAGGWLFDILIDDKYSSARPYFLVLSLASGLHALYLAGSSFLFFVRRTLFVSLTTFVSAAVHIVIAYFSLRAGSLAGIAWGFTVSNVLAGVMVWVAAYFVVREWRRNSGKLGIA